MLSWLITLLCFMFKKSFGARFSVISHAIFCSNACMLLRSVCEWECLRLPPFCIWSRGYVCLVFDSIVVVTNIYIYIFNIHSFFNVCIIRGFCHFNTATTFKYYQYDTFPLLGTYIVAFFRRLPFSLAYQPCTLCFLC